MLFDFLVDDGIRLVQTAAIVVVVLVVINVLISFLRRRLVRKVKGKKHKSDAAIFFNILRYFLFAIVVLFALFSFSTQWTELGITLGIFSAIIGFAMQKPMTGVAAWFMLVTKRPFEIGDRVVIGDVRGDVVDIALSYVALREVGGLIEGEDKSGRTVMVPNATLFEKNIVNYTHDDNFVLYEVPVTVTYESDLDAAIAIAKKVLKKHTEKLDPPDAPYVRVAFQPSGIDMKAKAYLPASQLMKLSSEITKDLFAEIKKHKKVEIAYPHVEILHRKK